MVVTMTIGKELVNSLRSFLKADGARAPGVEYHLLTLLASTADLLCYNNPNHRQIQGRASLPGYHPTFQPPALVQGRD